MLPQMVISITVDEERIYENWIPNKNTRVFDEKILISGRLIVEDGIELILEGCEMVFNISQETSGGVQVKNGGTFIMRNSTLRMVDTSRNPYFINHGLIDIFGSRLQNLSGKDNGEEGGIQTWDGRGRIDTSVITSCENSAVYCYRSNVTIKDTAIMKNPKNGICINNSEVTIEDCRIYKNGLHGIEVFRSHAMIIDNKIHDHEVGWYEGHGISLQDSVALIKDNDLKNNAMNIVCSRSQTQIISNNITNGNYGIQVNSLIGYDNNADSPSQDPDENYLSKGVIEDNTVTGQGLFGIQVLESDFNVISNNISDVEYDGIFIRGTSPLVEGNNVTGCGIFVGDGCRSQLINNSCNEITVNFYSFVDIVNSRISKSVNVRSYSWAKIKKYISIEVQDENGLPVNDALIEIYSEKMNESYTGRTNPEGIIQQIPLTVFQKSAPDYASWVIKKEYYSPYWIYAEKNGVGNGKEKIDINDFNKVIIYIHKNETEKDFLPEILDFIPKKDQTIYITDTINFNIALSSPHPDGLLIKWFLNSYPQESEGLDFTFQTNSSSAGGYEVNVIISNGVFERKHNWTVWVVDPDYANPPHVSSDLDRDWMRDDWEEWRFGDLTHVQWEDYDNDGYTNYEEHKNCTNPTDRDDPDDRSYNWWHELDNSNKSLNPFHNGIIWEKIVPLIIIIPIIFLTIIIVIIVIKKRSKN